MLLYKFYLAASEFKLNGILNEVKLVLKAMEVAQGAWILKVGDVSEITS